MSDDFDVVVIGGGAVGEVVAGRIAAGGLSVALVEDQLFGGECSYWACMPSKALLRPLDVRAAAQAVPGVPVGEVQPAQVLARRDSFTSHWDDSSQYEWVQGADITPVRGRGRLTGERVVEVTTDGGVRTLTAGRYVVLAVGSTAAVPPIPGLREATPWTSREATSVQDVPERLVVLGGGVVGVEMSQAMAGLGAQVTLISQSPLLEKMEPFAGELVADGLKECGVDVRTGVEVTGVTRHEDGTVTVTTPDGDVTGDEVLAALGRSPGTDDVGLDTIGLTPGEYLDTDDHLQVAGVDWLYAVGDCTGRALLTHMGKYQARVCADVLLALSQGGGELPDSPGLRATSDHTAVPQVVFTHPQAASVGLTEAQARDAGHEVRVVTYEIGSVAGAAVHADGYTGRASLVVDEAQRVLLGATFVGPDVAELLHSATIAVAGGVTLDRLWHAVPSYPTISEVWLRLLEEYGM